MLRLILFRHAEAVRPPGTADFDRPLSARGKADAAEMGERLAEHDLAPDLVVLSPSQRTRETWDLASRSLAGGTEVRLDPAIYEAYADRLLAIAQGSGAAATTMLVGHNPSFEDLARLLVGGSDAVAASRLRQGLPTAAVAVLAFHAADWREIEAGGARLEHLLVPASAKGEG